MCVSVGRGVVLHNSWISTLSGILKSLLNSSVAKSSTIRTKVRVVLSKEEPF